MIIRSVALIVLVVAVVVLWTPSGVQAAPEAICQSGDPFYNKVLFCDNFEDRPANSTAWAAANVGAKTPPWDMSDTTGIQVSTLAAFDGTKSLAFKYPPCRWNDGQSDSWGCGVGFGSQYFAAQSDLWVRMYVFYPTGYLWSPAAEKSWHIANTLGQRAPWVYNGSPGGGPDVAGTRAGVLMFEHEADPYSRYDQNVGTSVTFQRQHWYCIELHLVQGSSGRTDAWIDGVQKFSYTANWPAPWNTFFISGYGNTMTDNQSTCEAKGFRWASPYCHRDNPQNRYFDNIVAATARIGCLGGPPSAAPASSPPAPPTNVRVSGISLSGEAAPGLAIVSVLIGLIARRALRRRHHA